MTITKTFRFDKLIKARDYGCRCYLLFRHYLRFEWTIFFNI